ncbi:hypothetical protein ACP70R_018459 [Stipagrostis hirtigluma subsp. patula]
MVQSDDETGRRADADHLRLSRSVYVEPRLVDHLARTVDGRRADADHLRLSRSAYVEHLAPAVDGRASTDRLRPEGVPVGDHLARSGPGEARRVDEFWGLLARTVRGEPRHVDGRLLSPLSRFLPPFSRGVHELSGGVNLRQIVQSGRAELRRVDELRSLDGPRTAWSVPGERRIAHNLPVTTDEGHRVGSGRRGPRGLLDVLYDNFDRAHDGRMIAAALPVVAEADAAVLPGVVEAEDHAAAADDDDAAGAVAAEDNLANPDPDAAAEDQVAGEDVNAVDLGDEAIADRRALLCAGFGLFFAVALVLASVAYEAGMVQTRHEGFEFSGAHLLPEVPTTRHGRIPRLPKLLISPSQRMRLDLAMRLSTDCLLGQDLPAKFSAGV